MAASSAAEPPMDAPTNATLVTPRPRMRGAADPLDALVAWAITSARYGKVRLASSTAFRHDHRPSTGAAHSRRASNKGLSTAPLWFRGTGRLAGADPLVDHLPDVLIQLVLLPDAVRGPQQHRRDRHQPDRSAHRCVDPLMAPQADAQLTLPGG